MNWNAIAAISQCIGVVAIIFALLQVKAMRKERLLGATWEIFRELHSDQTREARSYIYNNQELYEALKDDGGGKLSELPTEARTNAERVSNTLDRVGYVVHQRLIPIKLVLDGHYSIVAKCWVILEPFIEAVKEYRQQKNYQEYFKYLATETFKRYMSREEAKSQLY